MLQAKYLKSKILFNFSLLLAGKKSSANWHEEKYGLKEVKISNSKLSLELEQACQKDGFLLFSEYLQIDQFGKNGFHATHKHHGEQPLHQYWGKALAKLCKTENIDNVIDFGAGNGNLGIYLLKNSQKLKHKVYWSGIEINKNLRKIIQEKFEKEKLQKHLKQLVANENDITDKTKSLVIFSFSLDNLPPEMFINTSTSLNYPTAIIGIEIKNGFAKELILDEKQLTKKGLRLEKGILKQQNGLEFNLTAWRLHPLQRACIPINAAVTMNKLVEKVSENSIFIIIDEFYPPPYNNIESHLNLPKDLSSYERLFSNTQKLYQSSGENLLYYPTFENTYEQILKSLGFSNIKTAEEKTAAKILKGKKIKEHSYGLCLAIKGVKLNPQVAQIIIGSFSKLVNLA